MKVSFYKYQGTGNDFIIIDNRSLGLPINDFAIIKKLCDRRFGIGADGLMFLQNKVGFDFEMVYYNSDGRESSMCGNGGRCIVGFAQLLGIGEDKFQFNAIDGAHKATMTNDGTVSLQMKDVKLPITATNDYILNTGSPHFVRFVEGVQAIDVAKQGAEIRYSAPYSEQGINVNFVEVMGDNKLFVRTYERGVEDETLSCGTGVVAAAIAYQLHSSTLVNAIQINTLGGALQVAFDKVAELAVNVWLTGPAQLVYEGIIDWK